jgi:valyl-tRNA synthetase
MRLEDYDQGDDPDLGLLDRWILSRLERVVKQATDEFEVCNFMNAFDASRNFIWHVFCDHYLEAAKNRLYGEGEDKKGAQWTLNHAVRRMLQLLAPVMPHLTEEIYSVMYSEDEAGSIHLSSWPEFDESFVDETVERQGDLIIAVIRDIRREKNRLGVSLNTPIVDLRIYAAKEEASEAITLGLDDISTTIKAEEIDVIEGSGGDYEVEDYPEVRFSFVIEEPEQ